jgi:EAL domain-containing protein (putative c-di-GMP-specific phosphodiesterase class I)
VECQVRLLTVEFGPIKSVEFIPIAEESGIICFVNSHVLRSACALIRELLSSGCRFESMAVQVSPVMLLQQRFVADVAELLREYNIPEGKLALEIYDSPVMAPVARKVMERLNDLGVELILGGFDFGPSGFKNMMTMPVDAIKLGRHFIWQLETNPRSGPVIEALIQAAGRLGIKLIAEGVETEQQNSLLTRYKCPYRQGFYYSPSVDLTELRQILEREDG